MRFSVNINKATMKAVEENPKKIMYATAWNTLQKTIPYIPHDTYRMRNSSIAYGVRPTQNGFTIGSATYYAPDVWNYSQNDTNWTPPLPVYSKWYEVIWDRFGNSIFKSAVDKYRLK